ncbi:hypothetical protein [Paraburkholderia oxyphila]|uniref:hypothetical protein n=1 Tax=Paraburkholderia oxyphila TaxID=614212 RepID=UPI0012EDC7A2|nr:hypothetical protein [Paraburkholderia oxyphila]
MGFVEQNDVRVEREHARWAAFSREGGRVRKAGARSDERKSKSWDADAQFDWAISGSAGNLVEEVRATPDKQTE